MRMLHLPLSRSLRLDAFPHQLLPPRPVSLRVRRAGEECGSMRVAVGGDEPLDLAELKNVLRSIQWTT